MKRAFHSRSSSSAHRRPAKRRQRYSTRNPSWEEQRQLGGIFEKVGEGHWPVRSIIQQRVVDGEVHYQLDWEPHPETTEIYEPTWTIYRDVADDLIVDWNRRRAKEDSTKAVRKARSRRIIPSSSNAGDAVEDIKSDAGLETPSLLSDSSVSYAGELEVSPVESKARFLNVSLPVNDKSPVEGTNSSQPEAQSFVSSTPYRVSIQSLQSSWSHSARALQSSPLTDHKQSESAGRLNHIISTPELANQYQTPSSQSASRHSRVISGSDSDFSLPPLFAASAVGSIAVPESDLVWPSDRIPETQKSQGLSSPFRESAVSGPISKSRSQPNSSIELETTYAAYLRSPESPIRVQIRSPTSSELMSQIPSINMTSNSLEPTHLTEHIRSPLVNSFTQDDVRTNGVYHEDDTDVVSGIMIPPLPIMQSIEAEVADVNPQHLLNSKANSSQESLNNVREVETVDGIMIPVRPILGPHEYVIDLPAEGKVKSAYDEVIKIKKKSILKFISRRGAPGTSDISNKKTLERNEMQDMLQRLHDTVTHTDLGLPLSQSQYELNEEENAAYAEYAGSKFVMLGHLIDRLKSSNVSIAIFAQDGQLQNLLQEYLNMKRVTVRRHDRGAKSDTQETQGMCIDLFATPTNKTVTISTKPQFVIAFDVSFSTSDPQVQLLRQQFGENLPIIHFLVTNSSEHIERCIPSWFTSNIRLKIVVRTTYLASPYLGGDLTYLPHEMDEPADGSQMTAQDYQRGFRKSPDRKLSAIADIVARSCSTNDFTTTWTIDPIPDLQLAEFHSPPKMSRAASRTPQPRTARNSAPNSRATTPVNRKRLLEPESENGGKRLRMTPVRDVPNESQSSTISEELTETRKSMVQLGEELETMKQALVKAQKERDTAENKAGEWQHDLAEMQHRYERNKLDRMKMAKENKRLESLVTSMRTRNEASQTEKNALKEQITALTAELEESRNALKTQGGDVAVLETAKEVARTAVAEVVSLQKSLNSVKTDFEFTRTQYQEASGQASQMARELEKATSEIEQLKIAADDRKRELKAMNHDQSIKKIMERAEQFKLECRSRDLLIKKQTEEIASLKGRRGVQTRGSSVQPAPSPNPRSRQASPATGHLSVPPSGSRASVLRNER